jgi:putative alpha-1,2-mannosidase
LLVGEPAYEIGLPIFEKVEIPLPEGKSVRILTKGFGPDSHTILKIRWNGEVLKSPRIRHSDLIRGGILEVDYGKNKN